MRKNLMNKFTLRILSLFIAIFIWLLVVNIEDPVRTNYNYRCTGYICKRILY